MTAAELRRVTLEEYIEANGGLLSFLEGLLSFAKDNGMCWDNEIRCMFDEADNRARMFKRIGL